MSNDDQKFWIGIASAFIIPTIAYVYTQGMTAQSISQLSASVDKYQDTVDILNGQILIIANNVNNNKAEIASVNKQLDEIELKVNVSNPYWCSCCKVYICCHCSIDICRYCC